MDHNNWSLGVERQNLSQKPNLSQKAEPQKAEYPKDRIRILPTQKAELLKTESKIIELQIEPNRRIPKGRNMHFYHNALNY